MSDAAESMHISSATAVVPLLASAALRGLGIPLEVPVLSWLAPAVVLTGIAMLVARRVQ